MTDEQLYIRNPAVAATEIDAETFLVEPETGEVFYSRHAGTGGLLPDGGGTPSGAGVSRCRDRQKKPADQSFQWRGTVPLDGGNL